jgi:hypothetical protein
MLIVTVPYIRGDESPYCGVAAMILHVTDAKHLQDYQIWLKINDDAEGIVDLSKELWGGMFEPLKDLRLFSQVKLDTELDTIV